jgi:hypothetical protein
LASRPNRSRRADDSIAVQPQSLLRNCATLLVLFFLRSAQRCFIDWDSFLLPSGVNPRLPFRNVEGWLTAAALRVGAAALGIAIFELSTELPSSIVRARPIRSISALNSETILRTSILSLLVTQGARHVAFNSLDSFYLLTVQLRPWCEGSIGPGFVLRRCLDPKRSPKQPSAGLLILQGFIGLTCTV